MSAAPLAPTGLTATGEVGQVNLNWNDSVDPNFSFYNVYRSTTSGGAYSLYAAGVAASTFIDAGVASGTAYF